MIKVQNIVFTQLSKLESQITIDNTTDKQVCHLVNLSIVSVDVTLLSSTIKIVRLASLIWYSRVVKWNMKMAGEN